MRYREVHDGQQRVLVVVCAKGDDPVHEVSRAVREAGVLAGQVTGIGGFRSAEVGYFDAQIRDYRRIPVTEQVEVLSLVGDVATRDGSPEVHVHAVLGRRDGSTVGGHLLTGEVWPTLEVTVAEVGPALAKRVDPETGLALISPAEAAPATGRR